MKISVADQAKKWFQEEMQVEPGNAVRFYVRYGGSSPLHEGFSLGVAKDDPVEPAASLQENGITYFVEEKDVWYFDGHHLQVTYNESLQEPDYAYTKSS